jgi:serine/threonine protein kinase
MANEFLTRNDEIVDGLYRLGALINRSIRSTVYKTEFGKDGLRAAIKIREYESSGSEELMERWRNAMELAHPNLLKIYATGSSVLNGVPIVYVVMERADESLNSVLAERALTGDEMRELLMPAVAALHYLHRNGYAHSRLGASNVLAVQDQL